MQVGDTLNNLYKVEKIIGIGAYGKVYLAEDLSSPEKKVAIKEIMECELSPDERKDAVELFWREVQILKGLHHEGLPMVYDALSLPDATSGDECHYLIMEYIDGETLEAIQKRKNKPFICREVTDWALQLAEILEYLHSRKPDPLIFRDLKPSNIMLDKTGRIRLIDFGIARFFAPGKLKDTYAMGTPGYSPPEQYGSGQSDSRSDVYSYGVTLYRLLCDKDPLQFTFKLPPLGALAPEAPPWLEYIVMKCVAVNPGDRFQTFAEIADLLREGSTAVSGASPAGTGAQKRSIVSILIAPATGPQRLFVCIALLVLSAGVARLAFFLGEKQKGGECLFYLIGLALILCFLWHLGHVAGCRMTLFETVLGLFMLAFLAAILVPGNLRAGAQGRLTQCKVNLKNIGTALELYSTHNQGRYPSSLEKVVPSYLESIPTCPEARKSTYSYMVTVIPDSYTVYCDGEYHTGVMGPSKANYPQYDAVQGLID
ncbi:MAG: serine/threonine-protein kinase [Candidatus Eremiobacteraeota bacterium]|nr:serine/threonine-protein kinase [Candidatus Eremiobacteraeota bacterium]